MTYQGELVEPVSATKKAKAKKGTVEKICILYPDCPPRKGKDRTGVKYGALTFLYPVCRCDYSNGGQYYYWLAECDCGRETHTVYGRAGTCGCKIQKQKEKHNIEETKEQTPGDDDSLGGFNSLEFCTRKEGTIREICKHYSECLSYRVGLVFDEDGNKLADRCAESGGNCYEAASDEDLKYYSRLARLLG
jgi:hypothetical protein